MAIYNHYIRNPDGTGQINFAIEPDIDVKPSATRKIQKITSVPSFDASGNLVKPVISTLDLGASLAGSSLTVKIKRISSSDYATLYSRFTASPPINQIYYDGRRGVSYLVSFAEGDSFAGEYISGTDYIFLVMKFIVQA